MAALQIYTDSSKMENGIAIAATTHDTTITNRRLPREASIFTAELTAMVEAMKRIELQEKMTNWKAIHNILRFEKCA